MVRIFHDRCSGGDQKKPVLFTICSERAINKVDLSICQVVGNEEKTVQEGRFTSLTFVSEVEIEFDLSG